MSKQDINETVKTIRELKRMREELDAEISAQEDLIKAEMNRTNVFIISGDDYKVTWNEVTSTRLDTAALKKALPEVAEKFSKTSTTRRFNIA
jgi:predicted phage-related endonuclease